MTTLFFSFALLFFDNRQLQHGCCCVSQLHHATVSGAAELQFGPNLTFPPAFLQHRSLHLEPSDLFFVFVLKIFLSLDFKYRVAFFVCVFLLDWSPERRLKFRFLNLAHPEHTDEDSFETGCVFVFGFFLLSTVESFLSKELEMICISAATKRCHFICLLLIIYGQFIIHSSS